MTLLQYYLEFWKFIYVTWLQLVIAMNDEGHILIVL